MTADAHQIRFSRCPKIGMERCVYPHFHAQFQEIFSIRLLWCFVPDSLYYWFYFFWKIGHIANGQSRIFLQKIFKSVRFQNRTGFFLKSGRRGLWKTTRISCRTTSKQQHGVEFHCIHRPFYGMESSVSMIHLPCDGTAKYHWFSIWKVVIQWILSLAEFFASRVQGFQNKRINQ